MEESMATSGEALTQISAALDDFRQSQASKFAAVIEEVRQLQSQGQVDPSQLKGVLAKVEELKGASDTFDPTPDAAATPTSAPGSPTGPAPEAEAQPAPAPSTGQAPGYVEPPEAPPVEEDVDEDDRPETVEG